ncbi:hypothetical protein SAMN04487928_1258 [Butyrivibrio proteoclasticus]|uniref:HTH cro/C1-type domain-containing protein n=1 Tax=Butyrivibrio proteoclasticus TaxID=43305 RepID=A0A1I5WTB4_9FIRM|nr:hypothetical protein [Butyrivibrio proteoclasticus]SFQ22808.1 hypothetical protein SAMN04487928_1258 [Butyrivibrio proteoclasticus]
MQIDYKEVGKRIRKYRERLNLTQEDLAFAIKTWIKSNSSSEINEYYIFFAKSRLIVYSFIIYK